MRSLRLVAVLGVSAAAGALVAVSSSATSSGSSSEPDAYQGPVATAIGGAAGTLVYPSIVNIRLVRAEAALARATTWIDRGHPTKAVVPINAAQANMKAAWAAAKYVIATTPPPPVATDGAYAHSSGGAPGGPAFASPEDTAMAVFSLEDDVVTTSTGLLGGDPTLNTAITTTINAAVRTRNSAVAYIHQIAPTPPPVAGDGRVHANASGGAIGSSWSTTMPNLLVLLDDEIQAMQGTRSTNTTLLAASKTFLASVVTQDQRTKAAVNQYWPPVVGDD
jgi:hypothetical protein